ncbi:MAG TPA: 3-hydroxyacyl-CoA dehydrogenase NAD-binding domain-containing protein [Bryobacteraceae bacterium]|jgi:3-hydroxyacyl-CoA dehydrogenase|nr:3-hydroxyacyl-CoA dehydrogenase NAD-binding domain-containing protein [Bryobacteraceae bacterium]
MTAEPVLKSAGASTPGQETSILIRQVAVLGGGTMGSRIAAHFTNAGLPVVLLDIAAKEGSRNNVAAQALESLKKSKPAAFYEASAASRIAIGNFDDDLAMLQNCDWVIEAVTENLAIKQALLEKVTPHLKPQAILTTNTSGLPIASIATTLPEHLRRRFLGTHFFNPPRYMRLVEIIATPQTDPAVVQAVSKFADLRLGKEVVFARDTPNFIANRIGVFIMLEAVRLMQTEDLSVEEVDALTGTAIGWPRTGTFRLADLVGLDVLAHVAGNFAQSQRQNVTMPPFIQTMLERRWLGDKTKQGFYKKQRDGQGKEERFALDWKTLEYRPASRPKFPSLEMAKNVEKLPERLPQLLSGDVQKEKATRFHWKLLSALWNYAADCLPEIADDAASVDRAMCAGFNWEMGPFQLWDAAGVRRTVERMRAAGEPVSANVERLLATGADAWYRDHGRECFDLASASYKPVAEAAGIARVAHFRASNGVVRHNPGASLVDLGDGVGCLELHSLKNAIGEDVVRMLTDTVRPDSDAVRNFTAFVISGDADNFSVGANLMQLLLAVQEAEWDDVDLMIRAFQRMTASIKFCPRPVVVAPFGMCLGGGAEIAIHAARRQAHSELYMGLVECGVGLLPAGGGCKEMTIHAVNAAASVREGGRNESVELLEALRRNFESIAMAKVSTSALEARHLGYLSWADRLTLNRDRLLMDAKHVALDIANAGYTAPLPRTDIPAPGQNLLSTLKMAVHMMREGEFISDHDVKVANWVAHVLCGGNITPGTLVSEQYLLDLEREAFLSLCGEKKTQERIAFTLKSGKPLRN